MSISYTKHDYTNNTKTPMTIAVGRVLFICTETHRIMSDVWESLPTAHYIDEDGSEREMVVGGSGEYLVTATVDATEEAYQAYLANRVKHWTAQYTAEAERNAETIHKGDMVRVTGGRTAKGAVGKVFWVGSGTYGMGYRGVTMNKYGIALSDRKETVSKNGREFQGYADKEFIWGKNVELVTVPAIDLAEVTRRAVQQAESDLRVIRGRTDHLNVRKNAA